MSGAWKKKRKLKKKKTQRGGEDMKKTSACSHCGTWGGFQLKQRVKAQDEEQQLDSGDYSEGSVALHMILHSQAAHFSHIFIHTFITPASTSALLSNFIQTHFCFLFASGFFLIPPLSSCQQ